MKKVSELVRFLKEPHAERINKHKGRYEELQDLSNVAIEIGNAEAYKSLQSEMREVFFDYLTAIVVDSIYKLVPHVLIIWVINLKWQSISVPLVNWQLSILSAYILLYIVFLIGKVLVKLIKSKLPYKFSLLSVNKSTKPNKI